MAGYQAPADIFQKQQPILIECSQRNMYTLDSASRTRDSEPYRPHLVEDNPDHVKPTEIHLNNDSKQNDLQTLFGYCCCRNIDIPDSN